MTRTRACLAMGLAILFTALVGGAAAAGSTSIVISQVYGGGGNAGATYTHDYIEIFNRGTTDVELDGMSLQYASATGTGAFGANTGQLAELSGTIRPGQYVLVEAASGSNGAPLPVAFDVTDSTPINLSGSAGKVALVNGTATLGCNGGSTACNSEQTARIVDLVGYGGANYFEGAAAPGLSNTTAAIRGGNGCTDTNNNAADFTAGTPAPRNRTTTRIVCDGPPPPNEAPAVSSTSPAANATGVARDANVAVTFSEPVTVASGWYAISCVTSGTHAAAQSGGPTTFTLDPAADFAYGELCTVTITGSAVTDSASQPMAADHAFSFTVEPEPQTPTGGVVVSEVYGGGGNSGATYTHDFIELRNNSAAAVSLEGWSVQYGGSTGTGAWQVTPLKGSIQAGGYYLIQQAQGAGGTTPLPGADATGTIPMSGTAGKVALVLSTTALNGACPAVEAIADVVGYGAANCFEGSGPAGGTANATSAQRKNEGRQDTDDNAADFAIAAPTPQAAGDQAPRVASTVPAAGAAGVARDTTITITFSEPVNVAGGWFTIQCATSGSHAASVSGGPTTFTLGPGADFGVDETCTVTIAAAHVTDQDANDPPDAMEADHAFSFRTADASTCGDPATKIHEIQGSGLAAPAAMLGTSRTIEGVVVGDYQNANQFNGFYVQEEDGDKDDNPATSEGIFVFSGGVDVSVGQVVRVRGTVAEFNGLTQLSSVNAVAVCPAGASVAPTRVTLPVAQVDDLERYEGMLVDFQQELTVTEVFTLGRFGEVSLSGAGRLYVPTAVAAPGAEAAVVAAQNAKSRIVLDDGLGIQNPDPVRYPQGGLSATNTLRVGDTLGTLQGVLDYRFSLYRVQPVGDVAFANTNPRKDAPDAVGGNLKVASFNVLNYFNGNGTGLDGPAGGFPTARGATTLFELERQRAKIVSALKAIDADVVGLMEIENDQGPNQAAADLVAGLNDAMGAGTYAYVDTGVVGTDEIKVALIYKPGKVTPVGDWKVLTSAIDPRFEDNRSRPALAQTFRHDATGQLLTPVVNHLKSKGSACPGDPDTGDGSGNCNLTRTRAAAALADWLATDPTGSGDPDFLIIGDLNAYTFETPITTLESKGYTNLIRAAHGLSAYSYVFNGESGYLDHALATSSLASQVTGVTDWHINPDEPIVLDYNVEFKSAGQVGSFYAPGPFRASDHDPVIVGLQLANIAPTATFNAPQTATAGIPFTLSLTNASDPSPVDTAAGFTYAFDCGGGYGAFGSANEATCVATAVGPLSVGGKVRDQHGAETEYRATVAVGVSFDGVRALTQQYVTDPAVRDSLLEKLAAAEDAQRRGALEAKRQILGAYVNQVHAQTGKSITAERAGILVRLASAL